MILSLDFASGTPIYIQIRNEIVQGIASGEFVEGQKLPTVRALALELGINSMTVNKAYQLLKQEGYIITDRRNGALVAFREKDVKRVALIKEKMSLVIAEAKTLGLKEEDIVEIVLGLYRGGGEKWE